MQHATTLVEKCMDYLLKFMQGSGNWLSLRNELVAGRQEKREAFHCTTYNVFLFYITCINPV